MATGGKSKIKSAESIFHERCFAGAGASSAEKAHPDEHVPTNTVSGCDGLSVYIIIMVAEKNQRRVLPNVFRRAEIIPALLIKWQLRSVFASNRGAGDLLDGLDKHGVKSWWQLQQRP